MRRYRPFLEKLDLTYTQYIAMMVLWEKRSVSAKDLGTMLYLDSGTLTPLLKKLESKGYLKRVRSREDERVMTVSVTAKGDALREEAKSIPSEMAACVHIPAEDAAELLRIVRSMMKQFGDSRTEASCPKQRLNSPRSAGRSWNMR